MPQVFIVGAPRSGTSLLLHAVKDVFGLPGSGESHVIPLFQRLIHWERTYVDQLSKGPEGLLIRQFPARELEEVICDFARKFYATQYPKGGWVDKTPTGEAVHGIALIKRIFPQCRVIATKRNGIEVVMSHAKKFGVGIEESCQSWVAAMQGLSRYGSDPNVLIVDQFDFVMNSEEVAGDICAHLGFPEKKDELALYLKEKRVQSFTERDWTKRLTLDETGWTKKEQDVFADKCGDLMVKLGYSL
jgi:hypothetical protein